MPLSRRLSDHDSATWFTLHQVAWESKITIEPVAMNLSQLQHNCNLPHSLPIVKLPRRVRQRREVSSAASIKEKVSALEERETVDKFKACTERISGLGFDEEDSERVVGQAFGWGKQAYWLNKKKDQVPNLEQIETVLAYLKDDLGLEDEDIQKVVKKFPEVVNLDVELRLKANIAHMQKAYFMKEAQCKNVVKRQPDVLGYTVDCEGSCYGQCNQCWVRL